MECDGGGGGVIGVGWDGDEGGVECDGVGWG